MGSYDPVQAAREAREAQAVRAVGGVAVEVRSGVRDPLPYCIYATVALLAWVFSPALALACFAGLGLRAYWRAYRAGLRATDCLLGDPRRVIVYLALLLIAGVGWTLWSLIAMILR